MRVLVAALALLILTVSAPHVATADGGTAAVVISSGASALFSAGQLLTTNEHSKGARKQAEMLLASDASAWAPSYAVVDGEAGANAPLSLLALRSTVLATVAGDGDMLPDRRAAFETLRSCWNDFVLVPVTVNGARIIPDCLRPVQPVLSTLGLDALDGEDAFANAPTLVQEVAIEQIGGNVVENRERELVVALLAIVFLDLYEPSQMRFRVISTANGTIVFPQPVSVGTVETPTAAPTTVPAEATGCPLGGTTGPCLDSLSLLLPAVSGVLQADSCAFAREAWIPPYSRIRHPQPTEPRYGEPPSC